MSSVGFEVDFFAVGEGKRSGDAIAIRWGEPGNYKVLVYDGGTKVSGKEIVKHIKSHYGTTRVDYVVNSHPDSDHASGLSIVMEELEIGELWMHQPWKYSAEIYDYFHDGRMTEESLARRLQEKMATAYALELLAEEKGIPIKEPFTGSFIGDAFTVLSPANNWYVHDLIQEFAKSPEQKESVAASGRGIDGIVEALMKAAGKIATWVDEHWDIETLRENVETSAENESSVILLGQIGEKAILLTGDAGIRALNAAADYADAYNYSLPDKLTHIQVPHHGSRNNVSPSTLDRILGPRLTNQGSETNKRAVVSAGKESTHPRKSVINAFIRRGVKVTATKGKTIRYDHNMPKRQGWVPVTPLTFSNKVESWE